jgi:hypothetical protein
MKLVGSCLTLWIRSWGGAIVVVDLELVKGCVVFLFPFGSDGRAKRRRISLQLGVRLSSMTESFGGVNAKQLVQTSLKSIMVTGSVK